MNNTMESNETILISVNIDNRPMRLRVSVQDEKQVLLASQLLNNRIEAFKRFGSNDPIDRLSWAALDLAGEVVRLPKETPEVNLPNVDDLKLLQDIENLLGNR
jgi:hypothetical protein